MVLSSLFLRTLIVRHWVTLQHLPRLVQTRTRIDVPLLLGRTLALLLLHLMLLPCLPGSALLFPAPAKLRLLPLDDGFGFDR